MGCSYLQPFSDSIFRRLIHVSRLLLLNILSTSMEKLPQYHCEQPKPKTTKLVAWTLGTTFILLFMTWHLFCTTQEASLLDDYQEFYRLRHNASLPEYPLVQRVLNTNLVPFQPLPDRLQQRFNVKYIHKLLYHVNQDRRLTEKLKPLPEAFVRVITPEEVKILGRKGVTIDEINTIAYNRYIVYAQVDVDCLAITRVPGNTAVYLRVHSPNWRAIREDVEALFYERGGTPAEFRAAHTHPHLTIGYTNPGMMDDDDVAKDDDGRLESCWANIKYVGPYW
jgi:hypothetical protein